MLSNKGCQTGSNGLPDRRHPRWMSAQRRSGTGLRHDGGQRNGCPTRTSREFSRVALRPRGYCVRTRSRTVLADPSPRGFVRRVLREPVPDRAGTVRASRRDEVVAGPDLCGCGCRRRTCRRHCRGCRRLRKLAARLPLAALVKTGRRDYDEYWSDWRRGDCCVACCLKVCRWGPGPHSSRFCAA